jgi:putative ABC transport system permease protein
LEFAGRLVRARKPGAIPIGGPGSQWCRGLLGVLLGIAAAVAIGAFSDLPILILSWPLGLAFIFSGLVGVIFALYPAQKAASLRPVDALRYE